MRRLLGSTFEDLDVNLLAGRDDFARMDVLLGPAHFGDVDEAFDTWLELNKCAVIGDIGDVARDLGADWILGFDALPWIVLQLLHAEADTLRIWIDADDLHLDGIADVDDLAWMIDAAPCHVRSRGASHRCRRDRRMHRSR